MTTKDVYYKLVIDINTDDDFALDIGDELVFCADTVKEVCDDAITALTCAVLTYVKSSTIITKDANGVERRDTSDYSKNWYSIRSKALGALKAGRTSFDFGGNQTITAYLSSGSRSEDEEKRVALAKLTDREKTLLRLTDSTSALFSRAIAPGDVL